LSLIAPDEAYSLKSVVDYLGESGSCRHAPSDGYYGAVKVARSILGGKMKLK